MYLNEEDIILIEDLVKITYEISKIYQELYLLELNNKEKNNEYQDEVIALKEKLDEENSIYQQIYSVNKIVGVLGFVNNLYSTTLKYSNNISDNENIKNRICIKLSILSSTIIEDPTVKENAFEVYSDSVLELETYKRYLLITNSIIKDIKKTDQQMILYKKYYNAFEYDLDENYIIENNFFPKTIETSSIYKELNEDKKIEILLKDGATIIKKMINYNDEDFENINATGSLLSLYITLRSYMLLMDEDMIEVLKNFYYQCITDNNYLKTHKNDKNKKAFKLLSKAFEESKSDKVRYRTEK